MEIFTGILVRGLEVRAQRITQGFVALSYLFKQEVAVIFILDSSIGF